MFWRSDGIQDLFVNWKACTSSVHHEVHFRVFEVPVGERGRDKSDNQEEEGWGRRKLDWEMSEGKVPVSPSSSDSLRR